MNDALIDEIYKNSERVRIKNQVEEKLLHQMIEGRKGFREKLNKALSKLEKTRQTIAQDYYYMEKEMRMLGLSPRAKKTSTVTAKHSSESLNPITPMLSSISQHTTPASVISKSIQTNMSNKTVVASSSISIHQRQPPLLPNRVKPVGVNKTISVVKSNLVSDSGTYQLISRSNSMIGLKSTSELPPVVTSMTTKSLDVDEALVFDENENSSANFKSKELEEKCSPVPPTYFGYSTQAYLNKNSSKSDVSDIDLSSQQQKSRLSENEKLFKRTLLNNDIPAMGMSRRQSTIGIIGIAKSRPPPVVPRRKLSLDNCAVPLMAQTTSFIKSLRSSNETEQKPKRTLPAKPTVKPQPPSQASTGVELSTNNSSTNQRAASPFQNEASTCSSIYSASKTESDFLFISKPPQSAYSRRTSATSNATQAHRDSGIGSVHLPKIMNRSSSSIRANSTKRRSGDDSNLSKQRRVSFGRIEHNQMEMPNVFKYSNTGLERYKFNPHYYLPDGTLKRKFSLPKLSESLEAVKNCRYLRRFSLESADQYEEGVENIFKDLQPNTSELGDFDVPSQNELKNGL